MHGGRPDGLWRLAGRPSWLGFGRGRAPGSPVRRRRASAQLFDGAVVSDEDALEERLVEQPTLQWRAGEVGHVRRPGLGQRPVQSALRPHRRLTCYRRLRLRRGVQAHFAWVIAFVATRTPSRPTPKGRANTADTYEMVLHHELFYGLTKRDPATLREHGWLSKRCAGHRTLNW